VCSYKQFHLFNRFQNFNMQSVLIIVHLVIVLALAGVVLLQRSEGGLGLGGGASSSGSGFMTGRGQANALTRATAILGTLFFITSLGLAVISHQNRSSRSILDQAPASSGAPVSGAPQGGILDELRRRQGDVPAPITDPAVPQVPSAPQAPLSR
jgi:preprotein translocase subunit SecG